MVTMILVEDETFERRALLEHIDWDLIGVQIVGEAANGEQGLALVLERNPDIVLSDVNMPVMDGIEMARKVRAVAPDTHILFLSAYDDFDYARQAIDLNVQAYVVKPVNEGELLRNVKRAVDDITEKALERRLLRDIRSSYSENIDLACQALVNRLLLGMHVDANDARKLNLKWLCPDSGSVSLLLYHFDPSKTRLLDERLRELNRNYQKRFPQCISICPRPGQMVTLFSDAGEAAAKIEKQMSSAMEELVGTPISFQKISGSEGKTLADLYTVAMGRIPQEDHEAEGPRAHKKRKQIADDVEKIIRERYNQQITLETIAKSMHFTPNYLGMVFKSVKKVNVARYLMQTRMEKACCFLATSEKTVNDIALQCGFGSITYFHTAFKREYGLTPSEYRQKHGEKKET